MKISAFGQLIIGPPGSGKTTYCKKMCELLTKIGRKVSVVNIDPGNEMDFTPAVDVAELITVDDAMQHMKLGPNGALVYCVEYLEKNLDWLLDKVRSLSGDYLLFDCAGQVELYTHHPSLKRIMSRLQAAGLSLCTVHLVDSHYCSDPGKFISCLLMTLSAMLHTELPHVNVLSKVDRMQEFSDKLDFGLDFYSEVLDLSHLLDCLQDDPFTAKYKKLNSSVVSLVEDYSLVSFIPLDINQERMLLNVKKAVDKANGYVYGINEEKNVQSLLACAVQAETEHERIGIDRDVYTDSNSFQ